MPNLTPATHALHASRATRERVRGLPAADPERVEALEAAKAQLEATWTLELQRYVRSGRQVGRANSDDPVRVLQRERRAELDRLRSMLAPTPGRPRDPAPQTNAYVVLGHTGRMTQALEQIAKDHEAALRLYGGGRIVARRGGRGHYVSMAELNDAAGDLLGQVNGWRRELTTAYGRFMPDGTGYAADDERQRVDRAVATVRNSAALLAEQLRESANRSQPLTAAERSRVRARAPKRQSWPRERVEAVLRSYHAHNGRLPSRSELDSNPTLPHYMTLTRLYGRRPIEQLLSIICNERSESSTDEGQP
jgi:hypothetical protein